VDDKKRFIDTYQVGCPDGKTASVVFMPTGPAPEPPAGFRLIDKDVWKQFNDVRRSIGTDPTGALAKANELIKKWPDVITFVYLRAHIHSALKMNTEALQDFASAIKVFPNPSWRLEYLKTVCLHGEISTCIPELTRLKNELDKKSELLPEVTCWTGVMRHNNGDKEGMKDIEAACAMGYKYCCKDK